MAEEVNVKVTGTTTGLQAAMSQASASVKDSIATMTDSLDTLKSAFASVQTMMLGVTAILAGGAAFKDAISETVNLTKESNALGKQFGISATDASVLKVALDSVFVSQETMSTAGNKITQTMKTNEGAFKDLGVATRDQNGDFRSTLDIMTDTNARLLQFKEGTDRNVEGMKIYGRAWAEVAPTLKLTAGAMEEARIKAEELNLLVTAEGQAGVKKYRAALQETKDVFEGVKNTIGQALMPALTQLGEWFKDIGPQAIAATRAALATLGLMLNELGGAIAQTFTHLKFEIEGATTSYENFSEALGALLHGHWDEANAIWDRGTKEQEDIYKRYLASLEQDQADANARQKKWEGFLFDPKTPAKADKSGGTSGGQEGEIDANAQLAASIQQLSDVEMLHITKSKMGWTEIDRTLKEVDKSSGDYFKNQEKRWKTEDQLSEYHAKELAKEAAESAKLFQQITQPITNAFDKAFKGILNGTMSVHNAMRSIASSIAQSFESMATSAITNFAKAAIQQKLLGQQGALANIKANAASAASGAYNAVVAIPYVGPILAPAAAAVAYAGVLAFGSMASASGGYDIPAGVNPLTQLHQREMVLPAKYADAIRGMADEQGSGSQGDVHLHVHTQSTQDFAKFLKANAHVLAPAIRQMRNNFVPVMA